MLTKHHLSKLSSYHFCPLFRLWTSCLLVFLFPLGTTRKDKKTQVFLINANVLGRNHPHSGPCYPFYSMSTPPTYAPQPSFSAYTPPAPIIVTLILVVLFFFGFFAIYFFRCILDHLFCILNRRRNPSSALVGTEGRVMGNGLDPELIQAFPTFSYSSVKGFRSEKYGLECAICLGDFSDEDMLRLLTICCHVFHQECVDLWLESHKTCPVCRGDLEVPRKSLEKSPILVHSNSMHEFGANQTSPQDAVCIDIKDDNSEEADGGEAAAQAPSNTSEQHHRRRERMERFSRSHSTGHSIASTREEEERYTLRLPDHVKINIERGHSSAASCIAFGGLPSPLDYRNGCFGAASESRRGDLDKV